MADQSRRTTILLMVVAILFILTIIILCLPYDIGHKNNPYKATKAPTTTSVTTTTTKAPTTIGIHKSPSTTKDPTTRRTYIDTTTTTPSITTSTHSTDIMPKRTPTTSTSSSTLSTSSTISLVNTTENMTETTRLGHTDSTLSSTWSTSSTISPVNTTENMTETTRLGHTDSTLSSTWSTSSTIYPVNTTENMTETTTLVHTDSTDTSLTDNVTQTDLYKSTTEDNVNKTSDLSTEDSLESTDESTTVVETKPTTTHVSTTPTSTTPTSTTTVSTTPTSTTTVSTTTVSTTPMVTTIEPFSNETVCEKTECKDFGAKMWLQRDTSADACKDFYQYACGAVVDSQSLHPVDAGEAVKRKIRGKILDDDGSGPYKVARDFYNSCLHQDPVNAWNQWSDASAWMDKEMQITTSCDRDELSSMLAQLIKNNFAPLFDVSLGLDDEGQFVTRVTPPILRNPFSDNIAQQYCLKEYKLGVLDEPYFDVEEKYEAYLNCTADGYGMKARLHYLELNLKRLEIQDTLINRTIDFFIKASELKRDPFTSEDLLQLDYTPFDIDALNMTNDQINWEKLLSDLFNITNFEGMQIQVYRPEYIIEINRLLSEQPVCDVLTTLWKESRYMDLVSPQSTTIPYSEEYCLDLTTSLIPELLYSIDETQFTSDKVLESIWTMQNSSKKDIANTAEKQTMQMISQSKSALNTFSILGNHAEIMEAPSYQMKSLLLLKRFRSELYSQLFSNLIDDNDYYPTMYTAFENAAFHPENKYYSASSYMLEEPYYMKEEPAYLSYPSLGAAMARTAIRLRSEQEQDTDGSCVLEEEFKGYKHSNVTMKVNLKKMEFVRDLSKMVWDGYMKGKYLVYKNEASHLDQRDFAPLPLVESTPEQLFYLRSAQIYCEKTSRLDLLAVKERGHIPGPIRVNRILMNEPGFQRAFSCKPQQGMCN